MGTGLRKVGVDGNDEHVIGMIEELADGPILCPFINFHVAENHNHGGRIKFRIHDVNASVIVPIFKNDPLNNIFFQPLGTEHIRTALIHIP